MVYAANIFGCTGAKGSRAVSVFAVTDRIHIAVPGEERRDIVI